MSTADLEIKIGLTEGDFDTGSRRIVSLSDRAAREIERAFARSDSAMAASQRARLAAADRALTQSATTAGGLFGRIQRAGETAFQRVAAAAARPLGLNTRAAEASLDRIEKKVGTLGNALSSAGRGFSVGVGALGTAGGNILTAGIGKLLDLGQAAVTAGINFNEFSTKSRIAFEVLLGSQEKAAKALDDLKKFSVSTPFELPEVISAGQQLINYGVKVDGLIPKLKALGDAAAAGDPSKSLPERLGSVVRALGQIQASAKLSTEELNQLRDVGIPAIQILSDVSGIGQSELRKLIEDGRISGEQAANALIAGFEKRYAGLSQRIARETIEGKSSNIKDSINQKLGAATQQGYGTFLGTLDKAQAAVDGPGGTAILNAVGKTTEIAITSIDEIVNSLPSGAYVAKFMDVGADVMDGFFNGVVGGTEKVKSAIVGVLEEFIQATNRKLGRNSPSKVFAEIGDDIIEGLKLGLKNGDKEGVQKLLRDLVDVPNVRSFLDATAKAESTAQRANSGYNTLFGGGQFFDYSKHPGFAGAKYQGRTQSASGRYQIQIGTYNDVSRQTGLTGFDPKTQDAMAAYLLFKDGGLDNVLKGDFKGGFFASRKTYASFPGAGYKQPERSMEFMLRAAEESLQKQKAAADQSAASTTAASQEIERLKSQAEAAAASLKRIADEEARIPHSKRYTGDLRDPFYDPKLAANDEARRTLDIQQRVFERIDSERRPDQIAASDSRISGGLNESGLTRGAAAFDAAQAGLRNLEIGRSLEKANAGFDATSQAEWRKRLVIPPEVKGENDRRANQMAESINRILGDAMDEALNLRPMAALKSLGQGALSIFKGLAKELLTGSLSQAINQLFGRGGGQPGAPGAATGGGGIGALFRGLFGGGGQGGGFSVPGFAGGQINLGGGGTLTQQTQQAGLLSGIFGGGGGSRGGLLGGLFGGGASRGGFDFAALSRAGFDVSALPGAGGAAGALGGFGGVVGGLAPLLGGAIGQRIGGTLGQFGGLALGGFGAASAGLLGSGAVAGLLSNPFTAVAGVGLLAGGFLFGRARQRKADEKSRNNIQIDATKRLDEILAQLRSRQLDGDSAIAQSRQVFDEAEKAFSAIKTRKVRENAFRDYIPDLKKLLDTIKAEAGKRKAEQERFTVLQSATEFANGGLIDAVMRFPRFGEGGSMSPFRGLLRGGRGWPADDLLGLAPGGLVRLSGNEAVLNPPQIAALGGAPAMRRAGVPGFADGGLIAQPSAPAASGAEPITVNVYLQCNVEPSEVVVKGVRTERGGRAVTAAVQANVRKG